MRLLVLGGTGEARALAAALHGRPGFSVTSSLAGRVSDPALPAGATVIGGFGGPAGLAAYLTEHRVDALVDATHPFAATISANAVAAAASAGVPLLALRRPGWTERPGDRWTRVPTVAAAAAETRRLCPPGGCVFVTTGRRELAPFTADPDRRYLVRAVDPPDAGDLPARSLLLLDRGPYSAAAERALLLEHDVRVVISRDSGGDATYGKITAAREHGLPVVLVDRPAAPHPAPPTVHSVAAAITWCHGYADLPHRA